LLDESAIQPHAVLWARSLIVRPGIYNAIAYVQNPNETAGVQLVRYHMGFYDDQNFLVAERDGITPIMPGGITPILEGNVDAGNRVISHTYFQFSEPLIWKRLKSIAASVAVTNIKVQDIETSPRISATVTNNSFDDITNLSFVATVFNTVGNAFAASGTHLDRLAAGEVVTITFTWPAPFAYDVNKLDIIPVHAPVEATIGKQ
jgi:hypothetical protein